MPRAAPPSRMRPPPPNSRRPLPVKKARRCDLTLPPAKPASSPPRQSWDPTTASRAWCRWLRGRRGYGASWGAWRRHPGPRARAGPALLVPRGAADLAVAAPAAAVGRPAGEAAKGGRVPAMLEYAWGSGRITAAGLAPGSVGAGVVEVHCAPYRGDQGDVIGA